VATGAVSGQTDHAGLGAEWQAARADAERSDGLMGTRGKPAQRQAKMLCSQVTRVHSVVWQRGDAVAGILSNEQADADTHRAVCAAVTQKVISLGEMMVEKQPGMAYALAGFVLHVGEQHPTLWDCVQKQLQAACCYCVPYFPAKPAGGSNDDHLLLLGYRFKSDGKTFEAKKDHYARAAGHVTLYAALLQQSWVAHFRPPREDMQRRPVSNPLGVAAAWTWLARLVNQPPRQITATLLLAFLKPSAHALLAAYPKQFPKLLRFLASTYSAKIHAKVDGSDKPPEEQAALMTLDSWLKDTLAGLTASRQIPPPKEMLDMPEFKPPDDTRDSSGNDF